MDTTSRKRNRINANFVVVLLHIVDILRLFVPVQLRPSAPLLHQVIPRTCRNPRPHYESICETRP